MKFKRGELSSHDRLLSSNLDIVSVLIARRFKQERVKWHNKQQRLRLVSPRAASLPLCSSRRLLPTATAADVAAAWALLPSSTVRCVSYSLLVCCCCATLLLLRSSYFPAILPPGTTPPPVLPDSPIFPLRSAKLQTVPTFLHIFRASR